MAGLRRTDHGVEQVAAAVGQQALSPRSAQGNRDIETSLAVDDRVKDRPAVSRPLWRLAGWSVALV